MKLRSKVFVGLACVALLAGGAWWQLQKRAVPKPAAPSAASEATEQPLDVLSSDLTRAAPSELRRTIPLTGSLKPVQQTLVKARVAGELKTLEVREGQAVSKGQRIGSIDFTEWEWRLKERQALVRSAEANFASAQRTHDNNRQLLEKNFISQAAFDASTFALDAARANREAALAQLQGAQKSLSDAVLVAPIAGVVAERFAQPGEKLAVDNRIVSIMDLSLMEIEAGVPAAEVGRIRLGQRVSLQVEGIATPQTGSVVRIAPATSAGTRSVPVFIRIAPSDASSALRSGLFAQGVLEVERNAVPIAVPESAVRDQSGRSLVYRVQDGRIDIVEVKPGLRGLSDQGQAMVAISSGLSSGDTIVGANLGVLRAGTLVKAR